MDPRTRQGAGGGRKLLIPFYLFLSLLSHLPVMLCVSPGISRSYSCALPAAGAAQPHSTLRPGAGPRLPHAGRRLRFWTTLPLDLPGLVLASATSSERRKAPHMAPSRVCMLSISRSRRQVPGTGLHGCCALQVGVGGKDQAHLSML